MYLDYVSPSRDNWKFTYTGRELVLPALDKYEGFRVAELAARKALAALIADPNVNQADRRISELKTEAEFSGRNAESCLVFLHEAFRATNREFLLSVGDVVFFNLVPAALVPGVQQMRAKTADVAASCGQVSS